MAATVPSRYGCPAVIRTAVREIPDVTGSARRDRGAVVDQAEALFLVEFRGGSTSPRDLVDMHDALRQAVTRLGTTGVPIVWRSGLLLPVECRCLCLVQAARESDVLLARDTAALPTARVQQACALTGDRRPFFPHHSGSEGRN